MNRQPIEVGHALGARRRGLAIGASMLAAGLLLAACGGLNPFGGRKAAPAANEADRVAVLAPRSSVTIDQEVASQPVTLPPAQINLAWPQPGGFANHAMHHLDLPGELKMEWRQSAGKGNSRTSQISATPIVADRTVYAMDATSTVSAFDQYTGQRVWRLSLVREGESAESGFGGGLAFDTGRLFVVTGFGDVFALDANTGEQIWTRAVGVPIRSAPTAVDGRVYVTTADNQFIALSGIDGSPLWQYRGVSEIASIVGDSSPAVLGDLVVVPFSSGELVAFQAQNGRELWSDLLSRSGRSTALARLNDISGRPVIDRGRVVAVSHSGRLVSLDLRSGQRFWDTNVASIETPWVAGDSIYVVTTDAEVIALTFADGRARWSTQLPAFRNESRRRGPIRWAGPVLAGGKLILASSEGELVFLSPQTGDILSEQRFSAGTFIAPVISNQKMFVLSKSGDLLAFGDGTAPPPVTRIVSNPTRPSPAPAATPPATEPAASDADAGTALTAPPASRPEDVAAGSDTGASRPATVASAPAGDRPSPYAAATSGNARAATAAPSSPYAAASSGNASTTTAAPAPAPAQPTPAPAPAQPTPAPPAPAPSVPAASSAPEPELAGGPRTASVEPASSAAGRGVPQPVAKPEPPAPAGGVAAKWLRDRIGP